LIPRLKLGFDNYAIRALGWKASRLLDYAASLSLDAILFSDPDVFESQSAGYLQELRAKADALAIDIHVGMLSICPSSVIFDRKRGTAAQQLKQTIRRARALGSPVGRCVLGKVDDRRSRGGIEARITETVRVLKSVRAFALDHGIRIAVENHAGDLQSHELAALIQQAGPDVVGATLDSGNATWALEDPLRNLEVLGPHALTTGIRDSMVWQTRDGAILQWTAMGRGLVDWKRYFRRYAELCPRAPVILETISGRPIPIPFLRNGFLDAYRQMRAPEFAAFRRLVRAGRPIRPFNPAGGSSRTREQKFQLRELEQSIRYCRETLELGVKK
jgi:sugar phosphate isomerase/epimerase